VELIHSDEHRARAYRVENRVTCPIVKSGSLCALYIIFFYAPVTLYPFFLLYVLKGKEVSFKVLQQVFGNLFCVIISLHYVSIILLLRYLASRFALCNCEKRNAPASRLAFCVLNPNTFNRLL